MTEDHAERLGKLADSLDNMLYAAKLPVPPHMHVTVLTEKIRSARDEIAAIVREATGEDPWETNPLEG